MCFKCTYRARGIKLILLSADGLQMAAMKSVRATRGSVGTAGSNEKCCSKACQCTTCLFAEIDGDVGDGQRYKEPHQRPVVRQSRERHHVSAHICPTPERTRRPATRGVRFFSGASGPSPASHTTTKTTTARASSTMMQRVGNEKGRQKFRLSASPLSIHRRRGNKKL